MWDVLLLDFLAPGLKAFWKTVCFNPIKSVLFLGGDEAGLPRIMSVTTLRQIIKIVLHTTES